MYRLLLSPLRLLLCKNSMTSSFRCLVLASCNDLSACRLDRSTAADASSASGAPQDSLLSLQYSKTEKPFEEAETHVVVAMQALHAQICPAVAQAAAALVALCMQTSRPHAASGEFASLLVGIFNG